jgi:hypothetical protein
VPLPPRQYMKRFWTRSEPDNQCAAVSPPGALERSGELVFAANAGSLSAASAQAGTHRKIATLAEPTALRHALGAKIRAYWPPFAVKSQVNG